MVKLAASDIIPCVYRFLIECGLNDAAKLIEKKYDISNINGISGKKLMSMCKFYLKNHPELLEEPVEEEQVEPEVKIQEEEPKTKSKSKKEKNKKEEAEKIEVEEDVIEVKNKKKLKTENGEKVTSKVQVSQQTVKDHAKKSENKQNGKSKNKPVEDNDNKEVEEEEDGDKTPITIKKPKEEKVQKTEDKPAKDKKVKTKKVVEEPKEEEEENEEPEEKEEKVPATKEKSGKAIDEKKDLDTNGKSTTTIQNDNDSKLNKNNEKKKESFTKIDPSIKKEIPVELQDNSFDAKFRYGHGDEFGRLGHEKLKDTRGKDFKKEKTKMKNKNFAGGNYELNLNKVNSIKLIQAKKLPLDF